MTAPFLTFRSLRAAAKRRLAASSVAPVHAYASNYHHSLRACDARFSSAQATICCGGDL